MKLAFVFLALAITVSAYAQSNDKGFDLNIHAHDSATPQSIGLPLYPGAQPYKSDKDDDQSADLGFTIGGFHAALLVASYQSGDAGARVADFYRKALAKYGDVLECMDGKPIGARKATASGLTCSSQKGGQGGLSVNGVSDDRGYQLRAGTPHKFRMVAFDTDVHAAPSRFAMLYLELPRDSDSKD